MNLWSGFLDLLFPPKCPFCRALLDRGDQMLCPRCQMTLPWLVGPSGKRTLREHGSCYSALSYEGLVVEAIHRYKFSGLRCYHRTFGHLMAQCAADQRITAVDGITWAPLSRVRLRQRGYDQAHLLAQDVGRELSLPVLSTLKKVRNVPPQSQRENEGERRRNVAGAYAPDRKTDVKGMRLLLMDDVVTSGATLEECIRQLKLSGAESVQCLTLARAGSGEKERKN